MTQNKLTRSTIPLITFAATLLLALPSQSATRDPNDPSDSVAARLKDPRLEIRALLRVGAEYQSERTFAGENGFSVVNARIAALGKFDSGFSYFLHTKFVGSVLLDARLSYTHRPALTIDAGQYKAPFSAEFLKPAGGLDFVNRSQIVTALAPARQIGAGLRGRFGNGWQYGVGAFNGNGAGANRNDERGLMTVGRLSRNVEVGRGTFAAGVNVAHSKDADARVGATIDGDALFDNFEGTRKLAGVDFEWLDDRWGLSGEYLHGEVDPVGAAAVDISGFHLTASRRFGGRTRLLVRYDQLDTDGLVDSNLVVLGYTFDPARLFRVRFNVLVPTRDSGFDTSQYVGNLQFAF